MAAKATLPGDVDFAAWLKSQNPYLNQQSGLYDSYGDVRNGSAWQNQVVAKRKALTLGAPAAPATGSTTGSGGGVFSTLRLTKNPALQGLFNTNLSSASGNSAANYADLSKFVGGLNQNSAANTSDLNQEGGFINGAFNGDLEAKLAKARSDYAQKQQDAITGAGTAFTDARARFGTQAGADIGKLQSDLAAQRAGYEGRTNEDIAREVAARGTDLVNYGRAATAATQLGVNQGNRTIKAISQASGNGGSSYTGRLGVGMATAANTELAQRLAELKANNTEKEISRRAGLTDTVSGLERGEISGAGTARLGLTTQLAGQERNDLGYTLGRDASLNDQLFNAENSAIQYVRDQAGRVIGVRRTMRNSASQDALLPVAARQAIQSGDLSAAGQLTQLDQANNFYGIDDGTGDSLNIPRIPSFNRSFPSIGGGGDITPQDSPQDSPQNYFNPTVAPTQPTAAARASNPHQNRSAAERAYYNLAGVYPDQDTNFEPNLWAFARSQVQSDTRDSGHRTGPLNYRNDFGDNELVPYGPEADGASNYFDAA